MRKTRLLIMSALGKMKDVFVRLFFGGTKTFTRCAALSLLFAAMSFVAGCSKDQEEAKDNNKEDHAEAETAVNPDYVAIDWKNAKLLSQDSSGNYQIQFSGDVPDIHSGSIITIDCDTAVHHIFVESVTKSGNTVRVTSSEAYLTDIFSNTGFTLSTAKSSSKSSAKGAVFHPVEAYVIAEDGTYKDLQKQTKGNTRFTHNLWEFVYNNDGQKLFSGNNYSIYMEKMNFSLDFDLEMTINFGGKTVRATVNDALERYRSNALNITAELVGTFTTEQKIRCDIHGDCAFKPDYDLWKPNLLRPLTIRFVVSGVPVVVKLRSDLFRQVELLASGDISAYTGFRDKAEGRVGFEWQQSGSINQLPPSFSNTFELTPPTIEGYGQISAKVWAFPRISVMLYDHIGPSFDIKPYLTDTIRGGSREQMLGQSNDYCAWRLDYHTGIDACCGLSLRFLGYEVRNFSTPDWNIVDKKLYHSPKRIEHISGRPGVGESQTVSFNVYDQNYLLNREVVTPLPQLVKFEANGQLSSEYGIARNGVVSVTWTPTTGDILYAKLYDVDGTEITWDTVQAGSCNCNVSSADWVDLGLPSGLLWYSRNVGASSPEDYGDYFAWGETRTKSVYNYFTYSYCGDCNCDFDCSKITKYNEKDDLTTLEFGDDAATANLGSGARTPTKDEWQELINNCTNKWVSLNGVWGRCFTGPNGNSIFLPAAGFHYGSELEDTGKYGDYWSSSLYWELPDRACSFEFVENDTYIICDGPRFIGSSVRPVRSDH